MTILSEVATQCRPQGWIVHEEYQVTLEVLITFIVINKLHM